MQVTGHSRKLYNEEPHKLYCLWNIITIIRSRRNMKERQLGKIRHRWDDNIKKDLKEIVLEGRDCILFCWTDSQLVGLLDGYLVGYLAPYCQVFESQSGECLIQVHLQSCSWCGQVWYNSVIVRRGSQEQSIVTAGPCTCQLQARQMNATS